MKNVLTTAGHTLAIMAIAAISFLASCAPSKEKMRASFVNRCNESLLRNFSDTVRRDAARRYCDCAGSAVVDRLTEKELREVTRLQNAGQDTAAILLLQPVIRPCFDTLMLSLEAPAIPPAPAP